MKLPEQAETPISSDYKPELVAAANLETDGITMCNELIWRTAMGDQNWYS